MRERELSEMRRNQPPLSSLAPDHPVRRLIFRFCTAASSNISQLSRSSSVSSNEPRDRSALEPCPTDKPQQVATTSAASLTDASLVEKASGWSRLLNVPKTVNQTTNQESDPTQAQSVSVSEHVSPANAKGSAAECNPVPVVVVEPEAEENRFQNEIMFKIKDIHTGFLNKLSLMSDYMSEMERRIEQISSKIDGK
ncbi:hypothetical protein AHF37_07399 [Paragonimus kellicotti]|nr:hypothetical protein AHF37_07399 [Paragonimus kellicotti]